MKNDKYLNNKICVCCGNDTWLPLPGPVENQSITTACLLIKEPIGKAQCEKCGFVQRIYEEHLGETNYYETQYQGYYDRPATEQFHKQRYLKMVEWIKEGIDPIVPSRIIDVGCGQGGAMLALRDSYPDAGITGLEPSLQNSQFAESMGFKTYHSRLAADTRLGQSFDLAVSIYVAQHVLDPVDFLIGIKRLLLPGGLAAIIVPNANTPNIELMWSDQNYAYTANQIIDLVKKAGLHFMSLHESPQGISTSWMVICGNGCDKKLKYEGSAIPPFDKDEAYGKRVAYLASYKRMDDYLCERAKGKDRVINFGSSFWTSILAAYCPKYWARVAFCTVDNGEGTILGKDIVPFQDALVTDRDCLVLGVQQEAQMKLYQRFRQDNIEAVTWTDFISC